MYTVLMLTQFAATSTGSTGEVALNETKNVIERVADSLTKDNSLIILISLVIGALIIGRIIATILRWLTRVIGNQADRTPDLARVNLLRRIETYIVLSIALIRTLLVITAVYIWWIATHDEQQNTAILGAGAVLTIILSGTLFNTLRDVASGSAMMAEQWYGVGDHVKLEAIPDAQGVVERVTLRSTRIRKVTGEILWINNKDISSVSVSPRGVHTIALEIFAKDEEKAVRLINDTALRLPQGPSTVVSPLTIMTESKLGDHLWHITAICEVAPGRAWMIEKYALDVMKELDEKSKVLANDPLARYADSEAERRFARTAANARKINIEHTSKVRSSFKRSKRSS